MKNTRKNRVGISTLVATVLILAIVVTLVGIVGAWATGYLDVILGRSGVNVTIENVDFQDRDKIFLTVMNKGVSETEIKAVFVNDKEVSNWSLTVNSDEEANIIKPNQIGRITATLGFDWQPETVYTIKISTSGYSQTTKEVTSPSLP